jgi:prephenate dehydrogenase
MRKTIGIVGYGNFGKFMEKHLAPHFDIRVSSRATPRDSLESTLASDIVIPAIPVNILDSFLRKNARLFGKKTVIVDVSSVKMKPLRLLRKYLPHNRIIGTHPLFGPESGKDGIAGLTTVLCPEYSTAKDRNCITAFLRRKLKLRVVQMTAREHDQLMAQVQALTHFIARALQRMGLPEISECTKAYEKLREFASLLSRTTDDLFKTIENENPFAKSIRKRLIRELLILENGLRRKP